MRLHVTGAGGFIGQNLLAELFRAGHELLPAVPKAQAVIHLAAIAHRHARPDELDEVNVRLPVRVARQAAAEGAHFLFLSSVKVHGEESRAPLTEHSAIRPQDAYAASKARAEEALAAVPELQLAVLRPPLVYGPGVKANFLALMHAVARGWPLPFGAVDNRRSFIYVGNLVDAILRVLDRQGTYLISDGPAISTQTLCRELGAVLGRPARLLPFPVAALELFPGMKRLTRSLEIDDSAARIDLGWRPPFTLQQGLSATADWYRRR